MSDDVMPKPYLTGECPVCKRRMRVRKDQTIGHHGGNLEPRYGGGYRRVYRCPGAGRKLEVPRG